MRNPNSPIEMSRYIDLETYHQVEATHPFYPEMIDEIGRIFDRHAEAHAPRNILEFGAGTGLATAALAVHPHRTYDAVEIDANCWKLLEQNLGGQVNCICDDAVTFRGKNGYDIAVSVFAHDHIPEDLGAQLARNIRGNLAEGGIYVMGGEILPHYKDEAGRREALHAYHGYIIDTALRSGSFEVAKLEIDALNSGLQRIGDFKRHEEMLEAEMLGAGFELVEKNKVGPLDQEGIGGVFVYTFKAS